MYFVHLVKIIYHSELSIRSKTVGAPATGASSVTQPAKRVAIMIPIIATMPNCAGFIRFILFHRIAKCADPKTSVLRLSSLIVVTFTI